MLIQIKCTTKKVSFKMKLLKIKPRFIMCFLVRNQLQVRALTPLRYDLRYSV